MYELVDSSRSDIPNATPLKFRVLIINCLALKFDSKHGTSRKQLVSIISISNKCFT